MGGGQKLKMTSPRYRSGARGLAGQDATLTRWRSPVRIRAGPFIYQKTCYIPVVITRVGRWIARKMRRREMRKRLRELLKRPEDPEVVRLFVEKAYQHPLKEVHNTLQEHAPQGILEIAPHIAKAGHPHATNALEILFSFWLGELLREKEGIDKLIKALREVHRTDKKVGSELVARLTQHVAFRELAEKHPEIGKMLAEYLKEKGIL